MKSKKWKCENADGSIVDIEVGDTVKIIHNLIEGDVSKEFLEEHQNEVTLVITKLNSRNIEGRVDGTWSTYLLLYPKNIIDIRKI